MKMFNSHDDNTILVRNGAACLSGRNSINRTFRVSSSFISFVTFIAFAALVIFIGSLAAPLVSAQSATNENVRQTKGDVNENATVSLSVPLGGYKERGSDLPVGLSYSGTVWRIEALANSRNYDLDQTYGIMQSIAQAFYAEHSKSGWHSTLELPQIEFPKTNEFYDYKGKETMYAGCSGYRTAKLFVHLPDGSTHELRKSDAPVAPGASSESATTVGTFYAVDGSRLRYDSNGRNDGGTLYMPDGTRYALGHPNSSITDRNGNTTSYSDDTGKWTDTLGREITDPLPQNPQAQDYVYDLPGIGSTTAAATVRHYTFRWRNLGDALATDSSGNAPALRVMASHYLPFPSAFPSVDSRGDNFPQPQSSSSGSLFQSKYPVDPDEEYPSQVETLVVGGGQPGGQLFDPVVLKEIVLPNGTSYKFSYNVYGEVTKVVYPTGGTERYEYDAAVPTGDEKRQPYVQTDRHIKSRVMSVDEAGGEQSEWKYALEVTGARRVTKIIAPDKTRIEIYKRSIDPPFDNQAKKYWAYGLTDKLDGMVFEKRSYSSSADGLGGQMTSRDFYQYEQTNNLVTFVTQCGQSTTVTKTLNGYRNARPTKEVSVAFSDDGTKALARTTSYGYDLTDQTAITTTGVEQTSMSVTDYAVVDGATAAAEATGIENIATGATARSTETTFQTGAAYRNNNILGLPLSNVVRDGSGATVSRSEMVYDEAGSSPGIGRGLATTMKAWDSTKSSDPADASAYIVTRAKYDSYGNVVEATDARGNVAKTEYSADYGYAYPTKVTTAVPGGNGSSVPFTTTMTYDFSAATRLGSGLPLTTTDANGGITTMEYADALLRPTATVMPDGSRTEMSYVDTSGAVSVKVKTQIDASNWAESTSFADGLGRTIKAKKKDAAGDVFTETKYDNMGRAFTSSNPYRTGTAEADKLWTVSEFDAAGRMNKVTSPDVSHVDTTYALSTSGSAIGTVVTVTDQAGKQRRSITNALGQLVRVDEPDNTNVNNGNGNLGTLDAPKQATYYEYDGLGNLTKVFQGDKTTNVGQTRTFAYDSLSRLRTATNPESGAIGYTYDNVGNLLTKIDARNVTTNYAYDTLNRVMSRSYTAPTGLANYAATPNVTYTYDDQNVPNSKGKLTRVSSAVSITSYTEFDAMGRVKSSVQETDNTSYAFKYEYNLGGALTSETYPSGRTVTNAFDADGGLSSVSGRRGDGAGNATGAGKLFAASFDYTAAGGVSSMRLGNGRWESTAFNSRLQPIQIALGGTKNAGDLLKINYDYGETTHNNNGNVLSQTITVPTVGANQGFTAVQSYTYDSLNRVKDAKELINSSQTWKQTFQYDRSGNRQFDMPNTTTPTLATGQTTQQINPTVDVANNKFTSGQGYTYDLSGNVITDANNRSFTYDGDNKQTLVTNASGTIGTYFYDGDAKRIKKIDGTSGEMTTFVYDAGGKLSAEYTNTVNTATAPVTSYLTNDTLGSARIITDNSGKVTSRRDFLPFGDDLATNQRTSQLGYAGNDTTRQKFTGYEKDDETALEFAEARMYNHTHGRFTSPDPLGASASIRSPQTFNRYSYVNNNPLNLIDPTGMMAQQKDPPEPCPEGATCDEDGNITIGTAGVVMVGRAATEPIVRHAGFNLGRFLLNGLGIGLTAAGKGITTGLGAVGGIITLSTPVGCAGLYEKGDGNGGCTFSQEKYDKFNAKMSDETTESSADNPKPDQANNEPSGNTNKDKQKAKKKNPCDFGLPDVPIRTQLAGKGQISDLERNPNLSGVNIVEVLNMTPSALSDAVKRGEIPINVCKQVSKAFEGRNLAGRNKNKK